MALWARSSIFRSIKPCFGLGFHREGWMSNLRVLKKNILDGGFERLCSNFTEGTMADWTAVYMKVVQTNAYFIGWGLAAYSFCMALGRLMGDGIVPLLGPEMYC